jgi:hypothetical protein
VAAIASVRDGTRLTTRRGGGPPNAVPRSSEDVTGSALPAPSRVGPLQGPDASVRAVGGRGSFDFQTSVTRMPACTLYRRLTETRLTVSAST